MNRRGSTKAGEPNLNRRGSTKDQNLNRHSGSVGTTNKKRQNSNPTLPCTDRNAIHEAYYFLMKAYVENNPVQKQNDWIVSSIMYTLHMTQYFKKILVFFFSPKQGENTGHSHFLRIILLLL